MRFSLYLELLLHRGGAKAGSHCGENFLVYVYLFCVNGRDRNKILFWPSLDPTRQAENGKRGWLKRPYPFFSYSPFSKGWQAGRKGERSINVTSYVFPHSCLKKAEKIYLNFFLPRLTCCSSWTSSESFWPSWRTRTAARRSKSGGCELYFVL